MVELLDNFVVKHLGLLLRQRRISKLSSMVSTSLLNFRFCETTHLLSSADKRIPLEPGHEGTNEVFMEFHLSDLDLGVFEE